MAKARIKAKIVGRRSGALGPAFPQALSKITAEHEIRIKYGEGLDKFSLQLFASTYSAKKWLEAITQDGKIKWFDGQRFEVLGLKFPIVVAGTTLEEIMEYEYTPAEEEWELPSNYKQMTDWIRSGEAKIQIMTPNNVMGSDNATQSSEGSTRSKPKPRKERATKKVEGKITANELAERLGVAGSAFRGALRNLKMEKPEGGWAWDEDEADEIIEKVKKALKK